MFKLSAKEKILVYLEDNIEKQLSLKKSEEQPIIFSQTGIEEAICVSHGLVSEGLASLVYEGLIERKRIHVRDTGRFRTFYFLTSHGILKARELKDRMGKTKIKLREKDEIKEMELSALVEYLKQTAKEKQLQTEVNYTNVLREITPDGFLDIRAVLEPRKYIDFSEKKPEHKYFVNRIKELNEINEFMSSKASKILAIKGIAGIGKTALVLKFIKALKINVFWYRINEWTTLRNILTYLSDFLLRIERGRLKSYLEREQIDLTDIFILLEEELKNTNSLFVFDDVQKSSAEVLQFLSSLKELVEKSESIKLIAVGREVPLFYDRKDVVVKKLVQEVSLIGLDKEDGKKILMHKGVEESELDRLYELTDGHPLLLELISLSTDITAEVSKYLKEEIYLKLDGEEKRALSLASTFRHPFPIRALFADDIDYEVIEKLVDKSLMLRTAESDKYYLHDILREFFYNRLTPKKKIMYHTMAAEFYKQQQGEGAIIEAIYHFLEAKKQEDAAELVIKKGEALIKLGFVKELEQLIAQISMPTISLEHQIEILYITTLIKWYLGDWDSAIAESNKSIEICKKIDNKYFEAKSYCKIGEILVGRAKYDDAVEYLKKALQKSEEINYAPGIGTARYWLGKASIVVGKLDEAVKHLEACLNISEKFGDERLKAMAYNDFGNVCDFKGESEKALELKMRSLQYFERTDDKYELARTYNNIGTAYEGMKDYRKAIEWYEKCIKIGRDMGIIRAIAYGLTNIATCYCKLGEEFEKAMQYTDEAVMISKKLGERRITGYCNANYGVYYHKKKDWVKAKEMFEESMKIGVEVECLELLSYVHRCYAKMLIDKGDKEKAIEEFKESISFYEKLGNKLLVEEVKKELEKLMD
ncbi:MAG: tetratricopeptide repeat protein [Candidatus Thermoplasmatota archaeon]